MSNFVQVHTVTNRCFHVCAITVCRCPAGRRWSGLCIALSSTINIRCMSYYYSTHISSRCDALTLQIRYEMCYTSVDTHLALLSTSWSHCIISPSRFCVHRNSPFGWPSNIISTECNGTKHLKCVCRHPIPCMEAIYSGQTYSRHLWKLCKNFEILQESHFSRARVYSNCVRLNLAHGR